MADRIRSCPSGIFHLGLFLLLISVGACTLDPTPYQPRKDDYGYEETRLQPNTYRVSFKANRATPETDVMDFLFLRSAELTRAAGFTHFIIQQDFGKTQVEIQNAPRLSIGMGFISGGPRSYWGTGLATPLGGSETTTSVRYHLGVFIIRMLSATEAARIPEALEIGFLIDSVREKIAARKKQK